MPRKLNLITGEIMKKIISFILGSIFALNLTITAANSAANVVRVAYFLEWPSPNLEDMQKKNFASMHTSFGESPGAAIVFKNVFF